MRKLMSRIKVSVVIGGLVALLIPASTPAFAGGVSAGGPWNYTRQTITAQFSGVHGSADGKAFAQTNDHNGGCALLKIRLKHNPGNIDLGWATSMNAPSFFIGFGPANTTAVSSQHRAQHSVDETWSAIQQPHAW